MFKTYNKFKMTISLQLFERLIAGKADSSNISHSVIRVYGLFILHFNVCVCVCGVCVGAKMTGPATVFHSWWVKCVWFTRLIQTLMENDTDCFTHTRSYELCALFVFIQIGEKQRCCESSGDSIWPTLYCGHHLKLLQHDRWIKPVRKD